MHSEANLISIPGLRLIATLPYPAGLRVTPYHMCIELSTQGAHKTRKTITIGAEMLHAWACARMHTTLVFVNCAVCQAGFYTFRSMRSIW